MALPSDILERLAERAKRQEPTRQKPKVTPASPAEPKPNQSTPKPTDPVVKPTPRVVRKNDAVREILKSMFPNGKDT